MTLTPHFATTVATAFLASSVEAVEALTVILAAGITRGWRCALTGAGIGALLLAAIVALLGPSLTAIPISVLQVTTGTLLLLFGMRWLRKAMLRYAGVIAMRDEDEIYARERQAFGAAAGAARIDLLTAFAVFKVVVLEGIEVIVIVIGLGAVGGMLVPASIGAVAAILAVALLGAIVHRPLARIPENALKLAVGVMVCAFGTFWFGEGVGIVWPYGDAAILAIIAIFLAAAAAGTDLAKRIRHAAPAAP
jgi:uncharacterized membrane protein